MFPPFTNNWGGPQEDPRKKLMRGLFQQDFDPNALAPEDPSQQEPDFMAAFKELLNRQPGPAHAAYSKYVQSGFPKEQDYSPTKMSRLSAMLSGAGAGLSGGNGEAVSHSIISRPYEHAVKKYGFEGQRLKEAASIEEGEHKDKLMALDKLIDNQRLDEERKSRERSARILDRVREVGLQKTQNELKLQGIHTNLDPNTGELLYVNQLTGQKGSYGKMGQSTMDRFREHNLKADADDKRLINRDKIIFPFHSEITGKREATGRKETFAHQDEMQKRAFAEQEKMEGIRQKGRITLSKEKAEEASKRDANRAGLKNPTTSVTQRLQRNRTKVQSLVDADPNKYGKFWTMGSSGFNVLGPPPEINSPEYEIFRELYNALYDGTNALGNAQSPAIVPKATPKPSKYKKVQ